MVVSPQTNEVRRVFFRSVFGTTEGIVCLARILRSINKEDNQFQEEFFKWPDQEDDMIAFVNRWYITEDVYFCPQLLKGKKRTKDFVFACANAWADLDECQPEQLDVNPSIVVESSPNRFQAFWCFEAAIDPEMAEDVSRRIAYKHVQDGADRSGWDLSQLLRVPGTYNHKYGKVMGQTSPAEVHMITVNRSRFRLTDFDVYPQIQAFKYMDIPFPEELPTMDADELLALRRNRLHPITWNAFQIEPQPDEDWSKKLWGMLLGLFEAGMKREEVYVVADVAKCNKYRRDGRDKMFLWRDVCKAFDINELHSGVAIPEAMAASAVPLLTDEEIQYVEDNPTFIERYIEWAGGLGDAAKQYHQAGAFTILASLLCGNVRLPTSFGTVYPNLWFMILADTTLTRKTTAMDIAMDLIMEVDDDIVLATDGSIEGLLGGLSTRPGRPSVFLRDEFSGLLEQITKRDYYAGMPELLTKLYDGKMQKRVLRKETIEVRDPRLIVFAGGIRTKIQDLLTSEQVSSGFMPRFIFITAESDVSKLKPLGPPTEINLGNKKAIKDEMQDLVAHYQTQATITIAGQKIEQNSPREWNATMTPDAWYRYNKLEADMLDFGMRSMNPEHMTPTFDRLSKSTLKAALLMATSRQRDSKITIEMQDILHAIYYMRGWRTYVIDVMNNLGRSTGEKQLDTIYRAIRNKNGVKRSYLMQAYHLSAREADQVFLTLEQRGLISRQKSGRTEQLFSRSIHVPGNPG